MVLKSALADVTVWQAVLAEEKLEFLLVVMLGVNEKLFAAFRIFFNSPGVLENFEKLDLKFQMAKSLSS